MNCQYDLLLGTRMINYNDVKGGGGLVVGVVLRMGIGVGEEQG